MQKHFTLILILFLTALFISNAPVPVKNNSDDIEKRIDDLISRMTLEEKVGQLNQLSYGKGWGPEVEVQIPDEYKELVREGKVGAFLNAIGAQYTYELQKIAFEESRMKIPLLFGLDVIHGFRTTFPVPIAEASTWQPELIELSAHYQALEASAAGIHWTFSPMVDIARDPRWGRIVEGSGEDPYLGSLMAAARVRGYQGNFSKDNIIACAKHFAAYGGAEGGRDYNTADISERTLREIYLKPFKASVDAGVQTIMSSFNEIGGIPSSGNKMLLTDILRNEWGFKGFVVSDWDAVGELVDHGFAIDLKDAGRIAINAGLDMDMESRAYITNLAELVKEKKVTEDEINESVKRVLRIKFLLGLFNDPYKYCDKEREKKNIMTRDAQNAALEEAQRSIVLLKNDRSLLPLKKDIKKIAVIGPLAESKKDPLGPWAGVGNPNDVVTVVEGLKKIVSHQTEILYSRGCNIEDDSLNGIDEAVKTAYQSDVVILCIGESGRMSGEANSRSSLDLPGMQQKLAEEIYKTGKPVVAVLMNGRPLSVQWLEDNVPAIVEAWFLGIKSGDAIAAVLFGDYNPSGKLPVTFPRTVGQVPIYYNHKNTGRPGDKNDHYTSQYIDLPLTSLYPFGFGLSYTTFKYDNLKLDKNTIRKSESLNASIEVTNTGKVVGEEVIQLYIRDLVGSVTRPIKELKGFHKIKLSAGETKTVSFKITPDMLIFLDRNLKPVIEPGRFDLMIGGNSADVKTVSFEVN